jgi:hypothetical protein
MTWLLRITWWAVIALGSLGHAAPAAETAPLRALDRFIGVWDVEIDVKPCPLVRGGAKAHGQTTNTWINNGQTQRQVWSITSSEGKLLFSGQSDVTCNSSKRSFRNQTKLSEGTASESQGKWDEQTKIFTWISRDPKLKTVTTLLTAPDRDGLEYWIMDIVDESGRKLFSCQGKNTRRP